MFYFDILSCVWIITTLYVDFLDEKEKQTRKKQTRKCCPATPKQTRKCCWDIEKRGALGETVLHVCLLNNTMIHNRLAKELIEVYPNLCKF